MPLFLIVSEIYGRNSRNGEKFEIFFELFGPPCRNALADLDGSTPECAQVCALHIGLHLASLRKKEMVAVLCTNETTPQFFGVFNSPSPCPQGPMGTTRGGGPSADIVPTKIIFGVDPCKRCWDITQQPSHQHGNNCHNIPNPCWIYSLLTHSPRTSLTVHRNHLKCFSNKKLSWVWQTTRTTVFLPIFSTTWQIQVSYCLCGLRLCWLWMLQPAALDVSLRHILVAVWWQTHTNHTTVTKNYHTV